MIINWEKRRSIQMKYFYITSPIHFCNESLNTDWDYYWDWCNDNLTIVPSCYYSGDSEVWGFDKLEDMSWWVLKWAS